MRAKGRLRTTKSVMSGGTSACCVKQTGPVASCLAPWLQRALRPDSACLVAASSLSPSSSASCGSTIDPSRWPAVSTSHQGLPIDRHATDLGHAASSGSASQQGVNLVTHGLDLRDGRVQLR